LKPAQIDALIAGYEAGKTMKDLAVELGINRLTVSAHLRRVETAPSKRSRHGADRRSCQAYDAGWSSVKLAERFGVSPDNVLVAWRRAAVVIRPRRGGPLNPPAPQ
jgi:hypothetical protein